MMRRRDKPRRHALSSQCREDSRARFFGGERARRRDEEEEDEDEEEDGGRRVLECPSREGSFSFARSGSRERERRLTAAPLESWRAGERRSREWQDAERGRRDDPAFLSPAPPPLLAAAALLLCVATTMPAEDEEPC
eukprot:NODE_13084_length_1186_cov_4.576959.p5 GENE.NODE_13084_length_1186_cov_4.576959~~NODE_13084_length_1186_cov_4.576959.p5  ORF type:complete len:137 (-),score=36.15 NODE_13084_length_1186_cov_4.576959:215-625(-)